MWRLGNAASSPPGEQAAEANRTSATAMTRGSLGAGQGSPRRGAAVVRV